MHRTSVFQVLKIAGTANILACAPSNSAADLLAERLLKHVDKATVLRLNALSRSWSTVPDAIKVSGSKLVWNGTLI